MSFLENLGISLVTRVVTVLLLVGMAAGAYWWFYGPQRDKPSDLRRPLAWQQEHVRRLVLAQAVDALLREAPEPGVRKSILLAEFDGDGAVELRKSLRNGLRERGYDHGEVWLLPRGMKLGKPPPDNRRPTRKSDPDESEDRATWLRRLMQMLPLLGEAGSDSDDGKAGAGSSGDGTEPVRLLYVEGRVRAERFTAGANNPALTLKLETAVTLRDKDGNWRLEDQVSELDEFTASLEPGSLEYAQVWMQNQPTALRVGLWLLLVGALPWATVGLIRRVLQSESNSAGAVLVGAYTLVAAVAAWAAIGLELATTVDWFLLLLGTGVALLYNLLMGEWLEESARL